MSKSHVKHSHEEHETKMGDSDGRADMAVELEASPRKSLKKIPIFLNIFQKFLNKFPNFLNKIPKLRI